MRYDVIEPIWKRIAERIRIKFGKHPNYTITTHGH